MTQIFCDRCGRLIYENMSEYKVQIPRLNIEKDLCKYCKSKLEEFFNRIPESSK